MSCHSCVLLWTWSATPATAVALQQGTCRREDPFSVHSFCLKDRDAFDGEGTLLGEERFLSTFCMTIVRHLQSDTVLSCKCCVALVFLGQDKRCRISLAVQCLSVPRQRASGCHRSPAPPPTPSPITSIPKTRTSTWETMNGGVCASAQRCS